MSLLSDCKNEKKIPQPTRYPTIFKKHFKYSNCEAGEGDGVGGDGGLSNLITDG